MKPNQKAFDAVAESRNWRAASSQQLDAMPLAERLAHLAAVRARYAEERAARAVAFARRKQGEVAVAPKPAKIFDAVAESRKWKQAVALETAGMTVAERLAYFHRHSPVEGIRRAAGDVEGASMESCVLREEPPEP